MIDYYSILNVSPKAGYEEIRKAYRRLAFRYHPDAAGSNLANSTHFRLLNEAYRVLSNPVERKRYHQKRFTEGLNVELLVLTPQQSFTSLLHLYEDIRTADPFRMPEEWVMAELSAIVPETVLLMMMPADSESFNDDFVYLYLKCIEPLSYPRFREAIGKLMHLPLSAEAKRKISETLSVKHQNHFWEKNKIAVAIVAAVLICIVMYFGFSL